MLLEGKDLNYNNMIPGNSFYCPVNIIRTFLQDNPYPLLYRLLLRQVK